MNDSPMRCLVRYDANQIQALRAHLRRECVQFNDAAINRFLHTVFESDELVQAYFFPRMLPPAAMNGKGLGPNRAYPGETRSDPLALIPYEEAKTAARQAHSMAILQPSERGLTYLAAFLCPCGLFPAARAAAAAFELGGREGAGVGGNGLGNQHFLQYLHQRHQQRPHQRHVSHLLLESGLKELGRQQPCMAETLQAVWGFDFGEIGRASCRK